MAAGGLFRVEIEPDPGEPTRILIHAKCFRPRLWVRQTRGTAVGDDAAVEQHETVAGVHSFGDIVRGHHHSDSPVHEFAEQREELLGGGNVEAGERFVEKQKLRLAAECAGDEHALALPAGKFAHGAVAQIPQPDLLDSFRSRDVVRAAGGTPPRAEAQPPTEHHRIDIDRKIPGHRVPLRDVAHRTAGCFAGALRDLDGPGAGRDQPEKGTQQRRLSRTVRTEQPDEFAGVHRQINAFEYR